MGKGKSSRRMHASAPVSYQLPKPWNKRTLVSEASLVLAAKKMLDYHNICFRRIDCAGKRFGDIADPQFAPGSHTGMADIIGCHGGRFFAIEVKAPGGRLSEKQRVFLCEISNAGGFAAVCVSVDGISNFILELLEPRGGFLHTPTDYGIDVYG